MKQPVAGASRTNCKRSASQINKVQPLPLAAQANTWLISLFNLWCSGVFILIFGSCLCWFHTKNTHVCFSTGAFRVGGLKGKLKQIQGFARVRGDMGSTEPNPTSAAPILSWSVPMGWRKTSILSDHSPAYTHSHGRQGFVYMQLPFWRKTWSFHNGVILLSAWISKIYQCPHYSPRSTLSKDFTYYQGHGTWAPT